jgi:DNA-binding LacI/PurR family transcriptional regulator
VDGIIIADSQLGPTHLSRVAQPAPFAVFLNSQRISTASAFRTVSIDNTHGGQLAATHLAGLEHRRVAYTWGHTNAQPRINNGMTVMSIHYISMALRALTRWWCMATHTLMI